MTRNQLPEGVGKKIVEALKRQAEADITPVSQGNNTISNSVPLTDIENIPEIKFDTLSDENDNLIVEEDSNPAQVLPLNSFDNNEEDIQEKTDFEQSQNLEEHIIFNSEMSEHKPPLFMNQPEAVNENTSQQVFYTPTPINIPSNVAVLKNLIATLPAGVSKQTGAQIIRQTLEAMGIPMTGVLKEAQTVQEELNSSTRECMIKIQEYKTNILQLEQSVSEYQKNITQINDLVSLFLLTDRK